MYIETQRSIGQWSDKEFPGADPNSPRRAIRALEEVVELCIASGATINEIKEATDRVVTRECYDRENDLEWDEDEACLFPEKIPAEAADVLIVLYTLAHMQGFDLLAEVDKKMSVNRARKWKANGDGTGYHVKESGGS